MGNEEASFMHEVDNRALTRPQTSGSDVDGDSPSVQPNGIGISLRGAARDVGARIRGRGFASNLDLGRCASRIQKERTGCGGPSANCVICEPLQMVPSPLGDRSIISTSKIQAMKFVGKRSLSGEEGKHKIVKGCNRMFLSQCSWHR
jgi:hypothetical protein